MFTLLIEFDPSAFVRNFPRLRKATGDDRTPDENCQEARDNDGGLKGVSPHHGLHPALQCTEVLQL